MISQSKESISYTKYDWMNNMVLT